MNHDSFYSAFDRDQTYSRNTLVLTLAETEEEPEEEFVASDTDDGDVSAARDAAALLCEDRVRAGKLWRIDSDDQSTVLYVFTRDGDFRVVGV